MDIYENIIIGNVLFALGFCKGRRAIADDTSPICVNLLQQTPLDTKLGDVLLQSEATFRLIEFKRDAGEASKDVQKRDGLLAAMKHVANPQRTQLFGTSLNTHWFISTASKHGELNARVVPYLHFDSNDGKVLELGQFAESLMKELDAPSIYGPKHFEEYVALLKEVSKGKRSAGSGGLILKANDSGTLSYLVVDDIMQLDLTPPEYAASRVGTFASADMQAAHETTNGTQHLTHAPGPNLRHDDIPSPSHEGPSWG